MDRYYVVLLSYHHYCRTFYQYLAAKFMDTSIDWEYYGNWNWLQPGVIYGVMLGTFYAGATIFTIYAIIRLRHLG